MEFYAAIRKNETMCFEGKCEEFEGIMLSEVNQVQKNKGCMFPLICGRYIQKINVYAKTNLIIYTSICRTRL
jgi:hypothetical protein